MRGSAGSVSSAENSTRVSVPGYGAESARHDRGVRCALTLEDPELELRVVLERAVPVEVVGLQVEENGNARLQRVDVLELERRELADDPRVRRRRADQGRERTAHVSGHFDISPGGAEDGAEELRRGRLPVRPGDAENRIRKESRAELDLAPDGQATRPRALHEHRLTRDSRALHDEIDPL